MAQGIPAHTKVLLRNYQLGEKLSYQMKATNQDFQKTLRYEVQANGVVKIDSVGTFFEEYSWSNLTVNGTRVVLPAPSASFRQMVSLSPGFKLAIPNLSRVHHNLIGPITDFLGFYADVRIAQQQGIANVGDHVYVKRTKPNSWADGAVVLVGEDAIDFDITLKDIDSVKEIAMLFVRHVPPAHPEIKLSSDWMKSQVGDTPNNWVQVVKADDGKYIAAVGKETFEVELEVSMINGAIVSARMDNLVEVLQRQCSDSTLTQCGDSIRYQIKRNIEIYIVK